MAEQLEQTKIDQPALDGVVESRSAVPRKDHRAALQAHKLRMSLATKAVCFGKEEPSIKPATLRVLILSLIVACVLLVTTIGGAKVIQMLSHGGGASRGTSMMGGR